MNTDRVINMLGFAMRAGKLILGTDLICAEMASKKRKIKLLLICSDSSPATRKKLANKSEFYKIDAMTVDITQECLAQAIGKTYSPAAVAICDEGFATQIREAINTTIH